MSTTVFADQIGIVPSGFVGGGEGGATLRNVLWYEAQTVREVWIGGEVGPGLQEVLGNFSGIVAVKPVAECGGGFFVKLDNPQRAKDLVLEISKFSPPPPLTPPTVCLSVSTALAGVFNRFPGCVEIFEQQAAELSRRVGGLIWLGGEGGRVGFSVSKGMDLRMVAGFWHDLFCVDFERIIESNIDQKARARAPSGFTDPAPSLSAPPPPPQIISLPLFVQLKAPLAHFDLINFRVSPENPTLEKSGALGAPSPGWRAVPLASPGWDGGEAGVLVLISHRESGTSRIAVGTAELPMEGWPVVGGGEGGTWSQISRSKITLLPYFGGILAWTRETATIFQLSRTEDGLLNFEIVRENVETEFKSENILRLTSFMECGSIKILMQFAGRSEVRVINDVSAAWMFEKSIISNLIPFDGKVHFFDFSQNKTGAVWLQGADCFVASEGWRIISVFPLFPSARLSFCYPSNLHEPLLLVTSADPKLVGVLEVWRLYISERLGGYVNAPAPRLVKRLGIPRVKAIVKEIPRQMVNGEGIFFAKPFPCEAAGALSRLSPTISAAPISDIGLQSLLVFGSHGVHNASLAGLFDLDRLDLRKISDMSDRWRAVTPLRWASPSREALFVIAQNPGTTAVLSVSVGGGWVEQSRFFDEIGGLEISRCKLTTILARVAGKEVPDLFVIAVDCERGVGGVFLIVSPREPWRLMRKLDEEGLLEIGAHLSVMYHRSRDAKNSTILSFLVVQRVGGWTEVRLFADPSKPSIEISRKNIANSTRLVPMYLNRPGVSHTWPCDVFFAFVENGKLKIFHAPLPDAEWRVISDFSLPAGTGNFLVPIYLPGVAEPMLLVSSNNGWLDLIRINLIDCLGAPGAASAVPRFIMRYSSADHTMSILDLTMDIPLAWLPSAALLQSSYLRKPLPFERSEERDSSRSR